MKTTFALLLLSLLLSYAAALALECAGLLPIPAPSLPAFISGFTGFGLLAIAFSDYSRPSRLAGHRPARSLERSARAAHAEPAHASLAWTLHPTSSSH